MLALAKPIKYVILLKCYLDITDTWPVVHPEICLEKGRVLSPKNRNADNVRIQSFLKIKFDANKALQTRYRSSLVCHCT